jgi:hypothetical protein
MITEFHIPLTVVDPTGVTPPTPKVLVILVDGEDRADSSALLPNAFANWGMGGELRDPPPSE